MRIAVIGAGPSGLTSAKNLLQAGLRDFTVFEKHTRAGGNWSAQPGHSGMYESVRAISSTAMSGYEDFPFPPHYPPYPSREELLRYFDAYADRFTVLKNVRFNTEVLRVTKAADRRWTVHLADGSTEEYGAIFICNGHHWNPRFPHIPGTFSGQRLHSHDYGSPRPFARSRVLVIGGGNSGCDIAVQIALAAGSCTMSLRRGYYVVPRYIFGAPSDVFYSRLSWLPASVIRAAGSPLMWHMTSAYSRHVLPKPDHALLESHPVINSEFLPLVRRRRINIVPPTTGFEGQEVSFADGSCAEFDTVIFCTGYRTTFPFFDRDFLDFGDEVPPLYLRMFHPGHRDLFFIGLVQPNGCIWPLSDLQAKLAANYLAGRYTLPSNLTEVVALEVNEIRASHVRSPRHSVEVDYRRFRRRLLREIPRSAPAWES